MFGFPLILFFLKNGFESFLAAVEKLPIKEGRKGKPNDKPPILLSAALREIEFVF
jgi:hypothetical protein